MTNTVIREGADLCYKPPRPPLKTGDLFKIAGNHWIKTCAGAVRLVDGVFIYNNGLGSYDCIPIPIGDSVTLRRLD